MSVPAPAELLRSFSQVVPLRAIGAAVQAAGKQGRRRRDLPAELVVQLVICLGLLRDAASRQVLAYLLPPGRRLPGKQSISRARYRIGPRPLMKLFALVARPLATPRTLPQAFHRGLRLAAIDATQADLPDTPDNVAVFGRPAASRGQSAFPQAKIIALLEIGTHAILDLVVRPRRRHEMAGALQLIGRSVEAGMLVLADRGFHGYRLFEAIERRGAQWLVRVKRNTILKPLRRFQDGSYLADVYPSWAARRRGQGAWRVRVIEYRVGPSEPIRLATSLLDPTLDAALELAALYHQRWELELVFDEVKTHQLGRPNGQKVLIRAQAPAGVVQEIYGLALAHYVVRTLMAAAAAREGLDPDRLSFKNALVIVRRHLPQLAAANGRSLAPLCPASWIRSPGSGSPRDANVATSEG
jgi:Transposase DDE domain/Insertion element 4 transposase N-terminal